MRLTSLSLIITTAFLAVLVVAGTVLLWSRFGRWRLLTRVLGMLVGQALVVATIGLIANRSEDFYPSWQALRGDTGTREATAPPPTGRLDATLAAGQTTVPWRPDSLASWRLASTPTVVLPPGYRERPSTTYPVVLVLTTSPAEAKAAVKASAKNDGVVTVVATPTAETPAAALGKVVAELGADVRATGYGWGLVTSSRAAVLAAALVDDAPGRFVAEAMIGAGVHPHGAVALALVRAVAGLKPPPSSSTPSSSPPPSGGATTPGRTAPGTTAGSASGSGTTSGGTPGKTTSGTAPGKTTSGTKPGKTTSGTTPARKPAKSHKPVSPGKAVPPGKGGVSGKPAPLTVQTTLTCAPASVWTVATRWAAAQTSEPLQPAVRLPVGARSTGAAPTGGLSAGRLPVGRSTAHRPANGKQANGKVANGRAANGKAANGRAANGTAAANQHAGLDHKAGGVGAGGKATGQPAAPQHSVGGHPADDYPGGTTGTAGAGTR